MISPQERSQLKVFVNSPAWPVVQRLADELVVRLEETRQNWDTEWAMVQATLKKEGQVEGVRRFLQEIMANII
jgi:hypothetical protein